MKIVAGETNRNVHDDDLVPHIQNFILQVQKIFRILQLSMQILVYNVSNSVTLEF